MNIFISQPMNGRSDEEILAERNEVFAYLSSIYPNENINILDTYFAEELIGKNVGLKYLAKSIDYLADADLVVFCKNYDKARGCRVEYLATKEYELNYIEL